MNERAGWRTIQTKVLKKHYGNAGLSRTDIPTDELASLHQEIQDLLNLAELGDSDD